MYEAYFFDIDGTLLDSVESLARSANEVLELFGLQPQPAPDYKLFAGNGADALISRALKAAGDIELKYYEKARILYRENCRKYAFYHLKPYAGIEETLGKLKNRGAKLVAISNKPDEIAQEVIWKSFGKQMFDVVLGLREGIVPKPNPKETCAIADMFGIAYSKCAFVGDTAVDIETGLNAKMKSVGVSWGFQKQEMLEKAGAEIIIDTPEQLLEIGDF